MSGCVNNRNKVGSNKSAKTIVHIIFHSFSCNCWIVSDGIHPRFLSGKLLCLSARLVTLFPKKRPRDKSHQTFKSPPSFLWTEKLISASPPPLPFSPLFISLSSRSVSSLSEGHSIEVSPGLDTVIRSFNPAFRVVNLKWTKRKYCYRTRSRQCSGSTCISDSRHPQA